MHAGDDFQRRLLLILFELITVLEREPEPHLEGNNRG